MKVLIANKICYNYSVFTEKLIVKVFNNNCSLCFNSSVVGIVNTNVGMLVDNATFDSSSINCSANCILCRYINTILNCLIC